MTEKLSTGIDKIDRELSGGIDSGSLFAISAGPAMQSEALFQPMMQKRPTVYLTALREPSSVRQSLGTTDHEVVIKDLREKRSMDNEFLKEVTGSRTHNLSRVRDAGTLDTVYETVSQITDQVNVIIDPVNPLEETEDTEVYRQVLNELKSSLLETGSIGILLCNQLDDVPPLRDVTLAVSDIVLNLELTTGKNKLQYQITIPKNRGGEPLLEETNIILDDEVWVDESRRI